MNRNLPENVFNLNTEPGGIHCDQIRCHVGKGRYASMICHNAATEGDRFFMPEAGTSSEFRDASLYPLR